MDAPVSDQSLGKTGSEGQASGVVEKSHHWLAAGATVVAALTGAAIGVRYKDERCVPNEQKLCETGGWQQGYQVCDETGKKYSDCRARKANDVLSLECPDTTEWYKTSVFGYVPTGGAPEAEGLTNPSVTL